MKLLERFRRPDPRFSESFQRVTRLARYNGRVSDGIVHTPEYVEWMRREQEWFDTDYLQEKYPR